jgi:hypothetical protein
MRRSSESVAALAAALAKAQGELANPEKSLTATIRGNRPGEGERSFRYAPLASGLDIVRKTLGRHEIATVQTTAIDPAAQIITLTTMLAHGSGEWIASDWPVCPVAETANPQRMGAALTYARRYALFTLVGIAGEDDLDAPELCAPSAPSSSPLRDELVKPQSSSRMPPRSGNGRNTRPFPGRSSAPLFAPDQSATLRDKLLAEVEGLVTADVATAWASQSLPAKNSLTATDAHFVEEAFESRLSQISSSDPAVSASEVPSAVQTANPQETVPIDGATSNEARGIDKSVLALPAPRRYRDQEHLRSIAKQPCLICGRKPSDPHHLRYVQPRALGRKASDEFVVPLCRIHHRLVHRVGNESAWWKDFGIDPVKVARKLWRHTRANQGRIAPDPMPQVTHVDRASEPATAPIDAGPPVPLQSSDSGERPVDLLPPP